MHKKHHHAHPPSPAAYKAAKEDWIAGQTGSSLTRIHSVAAVMITTYLLWAVLQRSRRFKPTPSTALQGVNEWWLEYTILVLPPVLAHTVLSHRVGALNLVLLALAAWIWHGTMTPPEPKIKAKKPHWSKRALSEDEEEEPLRVSVDSAADAAHAAASPPVAYTPPGDRSPLPSSPLATAPSSPSAKPPTSSLFVRPRPFLTVYRAHMMLLTVLCILAVDFRFFPREFSKCETFGTSLMDLGVGSFVFSLGVVGALPLVRSPASRFVPLRARVKREARRAIPLLLLGCVRVASVKATGYPEHVTEYGVHWNFFFTMAALPLLACAAPRRTRYSLLGLGLALAHQLLLSSGLEAWVLSPERVGLLGENKEGLVSLPGYLAVFFLGLDAGHYLLPLDPYFAYRRTHSRRTRPRTDKLAMLLASYALIYWALYGVAFLAGWQTSRRLANAPYVLWVAAFNATVLLAYVLVHICVLAPNEQAPALLEHINKHALAVFLFANVATGLVNLSVKTMYTPDWVALLILLAYTAACCGLAKAMHSMGWRMRL